MNEKVDNEQGEKSEEEPEEGGWIDRGHSFYSKKYFER